MAEDKTVIANRIICLERNRDRCINQVTAAAYQKEIDALLSPPKKKSAPKKEKKSWLK